MAAPVTLIYSGESDGRRISTLGIGACPLRAGIGVLPSALRIGSPALLPIARDIQDDNTLRRTLCGKAEVLRAFVTMHHDQVIVRVCTHAISFNTDAKGRAPSLS